MQVKIRHKRHAAARLLVRLLGLPFRLFPQDFVGWADDTITKMGVHSTTHIDAPWHYGPTSGGAPAQTIDQIPLERCIGPGVVLDMTHKADNDPITTADMEAALAKTGATLDASTIVLIRTGPRQAARHQGLLEDRHRHVVAATEWLLDRGVTVMGIDQWGWDLPFHAQIAKSKADNDNTLFWEAHRVGQRRPYWHMEQLTNLGALPPSGFEVAVLPAAHRRRLRRARPRRGDDPVACSAAPIAPVDQRDDVLEQTHLLHVVAQPGMTHRLREDGTMDERVERAPQHRDRCPDRQRGHVLRPALDRQEVVIETRDLLPQAIAHQRNSAGIEPRHGVDDVDVEIRVPARTPPRCGTALPRSRPRRAPAAPAPSGCDRADARPGTC